MSCAEVRRQLEKYGLLLLQDKRLPSVAGIITADSLRGSWWSDARAQQIFNCLDKIEEDALSTKLLGGKVTFVHQRL